MTLLDEVTTRLREGQAVEQVRTGDGWHIVGDRNAPLDTTSYSPAATAIAYGTYEAYQIEHVGHRPGGDLDVIVSATPYAARPHTFIAFRWDTAQWRPLVGRWEDLATAVAQAQHVTRFAGWDNPELLTLLKSLEAVA